MDGVSRLVSRRNLTGGMVGLRGVVVVLGLSVLAASALANDQTGAGSASATDAAATSAATEPAAAGQPATETAAASQGLEEVVVTATRRAEALEKVPESIQAVTDTQMEVAGVREIGDLERLTPELQITQSVSPYGGISNNTAIRGIASNAGEPTTGVYIDDTPIQPISGSNTVYPLVFDLSRVEVLRGPQGTLFGSGSEGGAIRFIETQPSLTEYSGYARAEGADTDGHAASYELGTAYGGPIIDDVLGFRVSAYYRQDGGWIDYGPASSFTVNHFNGEGVAAAATLVPNTAELQDNVNWVDNKAFHAALRFSPTQSLNITTSMFYQRQDYGYPGNDFWLAGSNPGAGSFYIPQFTPGPVGASLCSAPCATPGPLSQLTLPTGLFANTTLVQGALNIQWNIGNFATFTSTTSYVERAAVENYDTTIYYAVVAIDKSMQPFPLPGQFSPTYTQDTNKTASEELRLNGDTKYLTWLVGAWASNLNQPTFELEQNNVWAGSNYFFGQYVPSGGPPFGPGYSSFDDYWGLPLLPGSGTYYGFTHRNDKQLAGFAQVDFKLTHIFTLTAGIRETSDKQSYTEQEEGDENNENNPGGAPCPTGPVCTYGAAPFAPEIAQGTLGASARAATPKFALNAQLTDNDLVYASATKGFRIGGVQLPKPDDCSGDLIALGYVANGKAYTPLSYAPDYVWNYEVGTKDTTDDGKLLVNASVYEVRWQSIQTSVSLPTCGYGLIVNTGSATVKGFDLDAQFLPIRGLQLRTDIGYVDATLTDGLYQPSGKAVYSRGSAIPNSGAPWNLVGSARYEFPLNAQLQAYAYGDDNWYSQWRRTGVDDPKVYDFLPYDEPYPAYDVADMRLGVIRRGLDVSLFMNNVLNSHPIFLSPDNQLKYLWTAGTIRPRMFGITAAFRW